jgi:hypothetical protein
MPNSKKISKKDSGFISQATKCGTCRFYSKERNRCAIVAGVIEANNCCNLYTAKDQCLDLRFVSGQEIEDMIPDYAKSTICGHARSKKREEKE